MVGMGQRIDGENFAKKIRLDLDTMPLLVDPGPPFLLYQALQLREEASLLKLYANTVNSQTFVSAARGLVYGGLPTYSSNGLLTQLGGTFVLAPGGDKLVYEHIDTHTGVHAPKEDVCAAVRGAHGHGA